MIRGLVAAMLSIVPALAQAQDRPPIHLTYSVYAAGLDVLKIGSDLSLGDGGYRLSLSYATAGVFGLLVHSEMHSLADGTFTRAGALPRRFVSWGTMRSDPRKTVIDYVLGQPLIRELEPADDSGRQVVPVSMRQDTVDTLTAIVRLIREVSSSGRCDGSSTTFDGRRLLEITSHTVGMEKLDKDGRSSFSGPALRCDFAGRQLAGFQPDDDAAERAKIHHSEAWLAQAVPGGPKLPVRVVFETHFFGHATAYLTGAAEGPEPTMLAKQSP